MISDSRMPKGFWNEAIRTAAYILNRSPNANLESITRAELWYDEKPNVKNLKVFGTVAYSHVPDQFRSKFGNKSEKCIMIGYVNNGYRLWNIKKNKIQTSRNVVFNENMFYYNQNERKALDKRRNNNIKIRGIDEDNYENKDDTESEIEETENEELETVES